MALAPMHLPAPDSAVVDVTGAAARPRRRRRSLPLRRTRFERLDHPDAIGTPSAMVLGTIGAVHTPHR